MLKDRVLYHLEKGRGSIVTGGSLARELGVSRTAIWKAINALKEEGKVIESRPNSGYILLDRGDSLIKHAIEEGLTGDFMGRNLVILRSTQSTNQYIKGLDIGSIKEGMTVIADQQTSGRGRMGRPFISPAGEGIYMSILLKPKLLLQETQFLTICAAVAVSRAIEALCKVKMDIKWVNDIYYEGKKLCGILTEAFVSAEMQTVEYAVLGIGLNTGKVAPDIRSIATSLKEIGCNKGNRNPLIAEILNRFEEVYRDYSVKGSKKEIIQAYEDRLFIKGKSVLISGLGEDYQATVIGIDEKGGLIIRDDAGLIRHIVSGEIKRIKEQ
ncbi:MAG: biotin--[acetyl-CoA-carboxylase] ligase [Anaerovoracaceae bacterium]|jgi:BirA family biotin operon repressor/biotin-[acetyl-CoA-carboxylase] ligase